MNKKYNKSDLDEIHEDEVIMLGAGNQQLGFITDVQKSYSHRVFLYDEIKEPMHYEKVFNLLISASEHDHIAFFVSSGGGSVAGLRVLLEGLRLTEAFTTAIIVGDAHSSASVFALSCNETVVADAAEMLVHCARNGFYSKQSDLESYVSHSKKTIEKMFRTAYVAFLTDDEITKVLGGFEMWLDADEIRERLAQRDDYLEAKFLAEQEEMNAQQEQDEPKPKRKKKK